VNAYFRGYQRRTATCGHVRWPPERCDGSPPEPPACSPSTRSTHHRASVPATRLSVLAAATRPAIWASVMTSQPTLSDSRHDHAPNMALAAEFLRFPLRDRHWVDDAGAFQRVSTIEQEAAPTSHDHRISGCRYFLSRISRHFSRNIHGCVPGGSCGGTRVNLGFSRLPAALGPCHDRSTRRLDRGHGEPNPVSIGSSCRRLPRCW
jgi:hypothetical protein